jgi:beta-xylosidase
MEFQEMSATHYHNPVIQRYLADPFILSADGWHYLYASWETTDGRCLPIWKSRDLAAWEFVRGAVARGETGAWNRRNFWAPEVLFHEGSYWLYYTASPDGTPENTGNRVGLAVSNSPEGPFEDAGVAVPYSSLDGSPFRDTDGSLWLYYTCEFGNANGQTPGRIYVDRLLAPNRIAGEPREIMGLREWQEGACVLRREGRYYLFYSLGGWKSDEYRVAWAVGDSPAGPFSEQPGLLLQSTPQVKGPGHHNFFSGPGGRDWIVYHGWDPAFTARYPRVDPLVWTDGRPSTPGPTSIPQRLPC